MTKQDLLWTLNFQKDADGNVLIPASAVEDLLLDIDGLNACIDNLSENVEELEDKLEAW